MEPGRKAKVRIKFTEPVLGTCPKNPKTYEDYIASRIVRDKSLTEKELAQVSQEEVRDAYEDIEAVEERGWTTFMRDEEGYFVYNYWVRGFIKTCFQVLMETGDLPKIKAYKNRIDRFVHVWPRKVRFISNMNGHELPVLERPLRAMTARGPRVSLSRSDYFPPGTEMEFIVEVLKNNEISLDTMRKIFDYGKYFGMGQWASGGFGTLDLVSFE